MTSQTDESRKVEVLLKHLPTPNERGIVDVDVIEK